MARYFPLLTALRLIAVALAAFGCLAWMGFGEEENTDLEQAITANAAAIYGSPPSFVAGNPKGDVTVVAFFDHNCPYCRSDVEALQQLLAEDHNVRLVLKELPLLGADSTAVARVAVAAAAQGKYLPLYQALFEARGHMTEERALEIASELGLDMARLQQDMHSDAVIKMLASTRSLAGALDLNGVPYYLVGDRQVEGGSGFYAELTAAVAEVRRDGCRVCKAR